MKTAARVALASVALALLGGSFIAAARLGRLTPPDPVLQDRHALPGSRFLTVDGAAIHYVDEGNGPAVLLVHGSFGSLRNWDAWAKALASRYRVVRFDRPRMGLSGAGAATVPRTEQELRVIRSLSAHLGVDHFVLVATSSGGEAAAAYAAAHPQALDGLVLANVAAGPLPPARPHRSLLFRLVLLVDPLFGGWHPRLFWREILRHNFADPARVTPAMVAEWTDLNNRGQRMPPPAPAGSPPFARTPGDLARITVPTLLLWSDRDAELPVEEQGAAALSLLGTADKQLVVVPDCGHLLPLECGPASAAAVGPFLARVTDGADVGR